MGYKAVVGDVAECQVEGREACLEEFAEFFDQEVGCAALDTAL